MILQNQMAWLVPLSYLSIALGILSFLYILFDQPKREKHSMAIMSWVWPITGLWASVFGVLMYLVWGRGKEREPQNEFSLDMDMPNMTNMTNMKMSDSPFWQKVAIGTLHCGAGCTLADLIGPWLFLTFPFVFFGSHLFGEWALEYVLALIIGVIFQYSGLYSMVKERGFPLVWRAFKVDVLSLSAWQVGMYGYMAIVYFVLLGPITPYSPVYWLAMQIAMLCGFCTAYPMNWLLIKLGIKAAM